LGFLIFHPVWPSMPYYLSYFFFFNHPPTTAIYTLSLHDALPIWGAARVGRPDVRTCDGRRDPVYRLGTARWRADRSLAPHRATAAACDPGGRVVPGADAVPARGPRVPAGRRRAGTRCGRPDGARG